MSYSVTFSNLQINNLHNVWKFISASSSLEEDSVQFLVNLEPKEVSNEELVSSLSVPGQDDQPDEGEDPVIVKDGKLK